MSKAGMNLKWIDQHENTAAVLEKTSSVGRLLGMNAMEMLPAGVASLSIQRLMDDFGGGVAHNLTRSKGMPCRIADICGPILARSSHQGSTENTRLPMGNALLQEVSPELCVEVQRMPIFNAWKTRSPVLWIGGAGYHVHFDAWDNFFVQLSGRKKIIVYESEQTDNTNLSPLGLGPLEQKDGQVLGKDGELLPRYERWMEPGDAVFIPCGAMHALKGDPDGVSLNCFLSDGPGVAFPHLRDTYLNTFSRPGERLAALPPWFCYALGLIFRMRKMAELRRLTILFPFAYPRVLKRRLANPRRI